MPAPEIHTVVIGAGSAGLTVAIGLSRLGKRVALVECDAVGGDCTNVGCIPSKTLLELARALGPAEPGGDPDASRARRAHEALAEMRRRRDALRADEERMLAGHAPLELVRGRPRLARRAGAAPEVVVETDHAPPRILRARHVVIATGSAPRRLDVPGLAAERTLTNASVFELTSPPAHLVIVGAGAIGCELAFAFRDLGSRVTLIEAAPRVLPRAEEEASPLVRAALERAGVRVLTDAAPTRYDAPCAALHVAGTAGEGAVEHVDRVLLAVGRCANVAGLGLEAVGVELADGSVVTDSQHRTAVRGVYAIGDVTGRVDTTHAANAQGRRLVRRLALPLPLVPEGDYPSVTFARPEVAQIGPTRSALRARYAHDLLVTHRVDLADTDRGLTLGLDQGDGYLSVTAMRFTGRVLAATVVAPAAGEMIHLLTLAQRRRMSLWQLSRLVIAYPALSEAVRRVADAFVFASLPALHRELASYLRLRWRSPG